MPDIVLFNIPEATQISRRILSFPLQTDLVDKDIERITAIIKPD
jgi:hypothetical protein